MAAIDEEIVREYFEQNGFFVRQGRKYQVQARRKTGGEEIEKSSQRSSPEPTSSQSVPSSKSSSKSSPSMSST